MINREAFTTLVLPPPTKIKIISSNYPTESFLWWIFIFKIKINKIQATHSFIWYARVLNGVYKKGETNRYKKQEKAEIYMQLWRRRDDSAPPETSPRQHPVEGTSVFELRMPYPRYTRVSVDSGGGGREDAAAAVAATTSRSGCCDSDSDLVSLKITMLGDPEIGKTTFLVYWLFSCHDYFVIKYLLFGRNFFIIPNLDYIAWLTILFSHLWLI